MGSYGAFSPAISPDGKTIVFSTAKNYSMLGLSLYLINEDGTDLRPLGKQYYPLSGDSLVVYGSEAAWSPDGSEIAFVSNRDYYQADTLRFRTEIYKIEVNNKQVTKLTNLGEVIQRLIRSPDKSSIVFNSNKVNEDGVDINLINSQNEIHSLEKLKYGGDTFLEQ